MNQSVGGYYFDKNTLLKLDKFTPEKVFIAMGTNLCYKADKEKYIAEFFEKLPSVYGDVPVSVITPIWRSDFPDAYDQVKEVSGLIEKYTSDLANGTVIRGDTLIPHDEKYYFDKLHPNAEGVVIYGENLVKAIMQNNA